jgi:hypothetical protein
MARRWRRRTRQRVATELVRSALLEIRMLAFNPDLSTHPEGHLAEINLIADVCHNLPGAASVPVSDGYDHFVYIWQTASPDQQRWLREHLDDLGVDYRYLAESPPWPPPPRTPAQRPSLGRHGLRFPSDLGAFASVDTTTLQELAREAHALEPPGRKSPEWTLAHLHPHGHHIVRPSRRGEPLFLPPGPEDLRQYRGLLEMRDGATVVGHPRLRKSSFAALPANLSPVKRLQLAATPRRRHERDLYLWGRDHRAADPDCPDCARLTGTPPNADTPAD